VAWLTAGALWLHVICASWWVLGCVTLAVAGAVVNADSVEGREFVARVVPKFNRANAFSAVALLATGVVNLVAAGQRRQFEFSTTFAALMASKFGLYLLMIGALAMSLRAERFLRRESLPGLKSGGARLMVACSAVAAVAGAAAMMLGVWLAGE